MSKLTISASAALVLLALGLGALSLEVPASASERCGAVSISVGELHERFGIDPGTFGIAGFGEGGKSLFAFDREPDPKVVLDRQGSVRLWMLRLDDLRVRDARCFPLPLWVLEGFAPLGRKWAICSGNDGTKLLALDLEREEIRTISKANEVCGGFRVRGSVGYARGRPYAIGVQVEPEGIVRDKPFLAEVRFEKKGRFSLEQALDLAPVFTQDLRMYEPASPKCVYFVEAEVEGLGEVLKCLSSRGDPFVIDRCKAFGGLAVADDGSILYLARNEQGSREARFYEPGMAEPSTIAKGDFTYPFIAKKGDVLTLAKIEGGELSFFAGRRTESCGDWSLEPIEGLQMVGLGSFKLSGNGGRYAYLRPDRLILGRTY